MLNRIFMPFWRIVVKDFLTLYGMTSNWKLKIYFILERLINFKRTNKKKWKSYFDRNAKRMQYENFQKNGHAIGSGTVESAIRRVINLRIKSPSIFWKIENAESMIFIRSKVLYGRWEVLMKNLKENKQRRLIKNVLCYF